MNLKVKERFLLISVLPPRGTAATLRIVQELSSLLSFSEEEHKEFDISWDGGTVKWKEETDRPVPIDIGPVAFTLLRERLTEMNQKGELSLDHMPLYDHFVEDKPWALDGKKEPQLLSGGPDVPIDRKPHPIGQLGTKQATGKEE